MLSKDVEIEEKNTLSIASLKDIFRGKSTELNPLPETSSIRFFFSGQELKDDYYLGEYQNIGPE